MNPKCNPEMVLDLGVLAHSRISEETSAVKLTKDEDYANPEAATKMTIEIHRIDESVFQMAEEVSFGPSELAISI